MSDPLLWHRLQFAFTIIYHYLFPQLTMGLALIIVVMKTWARWTRQPATGTTRLASGRGSSASTSRSASSPASRWSSSSARTGRASRSTRAASSARRSRWKACSRSFSRSRFLGRWCSARSGSVARAHFLAVARRVRRQLAVRLLHHQPPTRSCSIRSGTRSTPDGTLRPRRLRALPVQSVGPGAVRAHDDRAPSSRRRSSLPRSVRSTRCSGVHTRQRGVVPARRRRRRRSSSAFLVAFPTGDHPGKARGAITNRWRSPRWRVASRAGRSAELTLIGQPNVRERRARQPDRVPWVLSFLAFGTFRSERPGARTTFPAKTGRTTSSSSTTRST